MKEFGEGVDRMFREMEEAGQPAPEYRQNEFMVYATIKQHRDMITVENPDGKSIEEVRFSIGSTLNGTLNEKQKEVFDFITATPGVQAQVIIDKFLIPRDTLNKILKVLTDRGLVERRGSKKTGGYFVK